MMLDDVGDAVLDGVGSILFDPECSLLGGNNVFRAKISFDSCSWRTIYDGHRSLYDFVWIVFLSLRGVYFEIDFL